jgi:hypothetical protein
MTARMAATPVVATPGGSQLHSCIGSPKCRHISGLGLCVGFNNGSAPTAALTAAPQCQTEGDSHQHIWTPPLPDMHSSSSAKAIRHNHGHRFHTLSMAKHPAVEVQGQMCELRIIGARSALPPTRDSLSQVVRWARWFWCGSRFVT